MLMRELLIGTWRHAFEEDSGPDMVYRPAADAFAPARGRVAYRFDEDGSGVLEGIAPTDGSLAQTFEWTIIDSPDAAPEEDAVRITFPDGREQVLAVPELGSGRLVLRPTQQS
jgi:hypothetical protein